MCYMILAGRKTAQDGAMLCGHNNDLQGHHASLYELLPRKKHAPGSEIRVSDTVVIPQVEETYACRILKVWRGYMEGDAVAVNEYQVAVAGGVDLGVDRNDRAEAADPLNSRGISGAARYIALQRSKTARECVEWIGRFYSEYGISYTCGIGVTDTKEAWYVEAGGGSLWVALRIPDDCYLVQANGYRIAEFNPDDGENVICSPRLMDRLKEKGLHSGGKIHFARIFGGKMLEKRETAFFNSRRLWGAIRRFNPSMKPDPLSGEYPVFLPPEKEITVRSLMDTLRDRFEDSEYDAFPPAGGRGKDRPICVPSCVHSDVIRLQEGLPSDIGAMMWGVIGTPYTSPYLPLHFGTQELPAPYLKGGPVFDSESAFWRFRALSDLALVDFQNLFPMVREVWSALEDEAFDLCAVTEKAALEVYDENPDLARRILTAYSNGFSCRAMEKAASLEGVLHTRIAEDMHRVFSHPGMEW